MPEIVFGELQALCKYFLNVERRQGKSRCSDLSVKGITDSLLLAGGGPASLFKMEIHEDSLFLLSSLSRCPHYDPLL